MEQGKHEPLKQKTGPLARYLEYFALTLFIASLFSLPFPFVRQIWLQSVIGAMGFFNVGLFIWLASRIRAHSYPAAFAGLGLVFHEQLLAGRGFFTLLYHNAADKHDVLFMIATVVVNVLLGFIFQSCLKPLGQHLKGYAREFYMKRHQTVAQQSEDYKVQALLESILMYCVLGSALYASSFLAMPLHFSVSKITAELTCVTAFFGIGREIDLYYREMHGKAALSAKVLSHLLAMSGVLWIIYRTMPIEPFLR